MFFNSIAYLAENTTGGTGGSLWPTLLMIGGLLLVFYFFMIRPQKKQENEVKNMRDNLVVGDEVTTIGGIIGKIVSIKEETCMIETGKDKVRIRFLKSAIRCVDVPNEAAREQLAAQRAAEAEKLAKEKAEREAREKEERLLNAQNGKKVKKCKPEAATSETVDTVTPAGKIDDATEDLSEPTEPTEE